jgi:DNA-binding NarL/FixJ family response regulator
MTISVVLADDQQLIRAGLRLMLETEPDISIIGEVEDGRAAVETTRCLRPDVVLMDIRMPVIDGIEATRRLGAEEPRSDSAVLILTTYDEDQYVFEALRAGASGFLLKLTSPEDLVSAVRTVAAGEGLLAPAVTRRLIAEFAQFHPPAPQADRLRVLTARERQVLELMGRGFTNSEIASHLVVGEATVKTHVGHVLMKLSLRDRVQAVILAYEAGLVRPGTVNSPGDPY